MLKLSVAVSFYKQLNYIEECLNSILEQKTNFDFNIVIRDDGSDDGNKSIEKIKEISKRSNREIILIEDNIGNIKVNRNTKLIFEQCKGEYVSYLDGDDLFTDENKLQKQVDFLDSNPDYVCHSTGYKYLGKSDFPTDIVLCSAKRDVEQKDIIDTNLISFGRTFRNIPDIIQPWMYDFPHNDWAFNFELLRYGKCRNDEWMGGYYRYTGSGLITSLTEEEIEETNIISREILHKKYNQKDVVIIDCFVRNDVVRTKLIGCISKLKKINKDIILISNTKIDQEIIDTVDHHIYDKEDRLFKGEYTDIHDVDIRKMIGDNMLFHDINNGVQLHGLSVLINLFNSVRYAKRVGYTHFSRIEVDDIFGEKSLDYINSVSIDEKALYYFNKKGDSNLTSADNISFHFFYSEIDFFLNNIVEIKSEEDYREYLYENFGNYDFLQVEEYINHNIKYLDGILRKEGNEMNIDFPDTIWNTVVSDSNLLPKYDRCISKIYDKRVNGISVGKILFSFNYKNESVSRIIECVDSFNNSIHYAHTLPSFESWCTNDVSDDTQIIKVYENGVSIYEDNNTPSFVEILK